jgi:hypothetical protein
MSKQQRILREMAAQQDLESEQTAVLMQTAHQAYSKTLQGYFQSLFLLLIVGIFGLGYVLFAYPDLLFLKRSPRLTDRRIMTIYPASLHIKRDLPRFFQNYATATPDNLQARLAVKQVAAVRWVVVDSGRFNHKLQLHAWEHEDFIGQLPGESLDSFCGAGFSNRYYVQRQQQVAVPNVDARNRPDDLVYWCLLQSGQHDGIVRWNVTAEASLTRGMKGVAGVYTVNGQTRVRPSFLFLPIRDRKKNDQDTGLSTTVPFKMMKWLLNPGNAQYAQEDYEIELYNIIQEEADRWVLLNAACTVAERTPLDTSQRRLVTECHADSGTGNEEICCSIYDPQLGPYLPRSRRDDDDDD